ncbi:MAG: hypothetical protein AB1753_01155 [Thermoproteota archaeon]
MGKAYAQQGDTWYVGQGAKADTHYIYRIQDGSTKEGTPFVMSLYFKEQDASGYWTVPVYVVENNGHVITGTLKLGENLAVQSRGSEIPKEMTPYIGAYQNSLTWLEAFTSKGAPKSLKAVSWGKIACIGCGTLDPAGGEKVTTQAGTFDTTVLLNHRGQVDSKIWVAKEMPYPVKALTYADVTTGNPPIQYAFELTATGAGQPPTPEETSVVPEPPLTLTTGRGTYKITLAWNPVQIEPDKEVEFTTTFMDSRDRAQQRTNYDLAVKDAATGDVIKEFKNQNTGESNTGRVKFTFDHGGPATITVKINSVQGVGTGDFIENADFSIVVVPEFPAIVAMIAIAGAMVPVVLFSRFGWNRFWN